jgi:hypothetical protein
LNPYAPDLRKSAIREGGDALAIAISTGQVMIAMCPRRDCTKKPMAAFGGVLDGGITVSRRARRWSGVARLPLNASEGGLAWASQGPRLLTSVMWAC